MASGKTSRHRVKQASKQAAGFANQGTQETREKANNRPCTYKTIVSCTYPGLCTNWLCQQILRRSGAFGNEQASAKAVLQAMNYPTLQEALHGLFLEMPLGPWILYDACSWPIGFRTVFRLAQKIQEQQQAGATYDLNLAFTDQELEDIHRDKYEQLLVNAAARHTNRMKKVPPWQQHAEQSGPSWAEQRRGRDFIIEEVSKVIHVLEMASPGATVLEGWQYVPPVYISGPPGTGKSYVAMQVLKWIWSTTSLTAQHWELTAVGAMFAQNGGGVHIHRLFGFRPGKSNLWVTPHGLASTALARLRKYPHLRRRLQELVVLYIDELGQCGAQLLYALHLVLTKLRGNELPFGGVFVFAAGDHYQTEPIDMAPPYTSWFMRCHFRVISLKELFRSRHDPTLQNIINLSRVPRLCATSRDYIITAVRQHCRHVATNAAHARWLRQNVRHIVANVPEEATWLLAKKVAVERARRATYDAANTEKQIYNAEDFVQKTAEWQPSPDQRHRQTLDRYSALVSECFVFIGARVTIVQNTTSDGHELLNGLIGHVVEHAEGSIKVAFDDGRLLRVYKENSIDIYHQGVPVRRRQFPLELAVATTIHDIQGATISVLATYLDDDPEHLLWSRTMLFTLMTRAEQLSGIHIVGYNEGVLCGLLQHHTAWHAEADEWIHQRDVFLSQASTTTVRDPSHNIAPCDLAFRQPESAIFYPPGVNVAYHIQSEESGEIYPGSTNNMGKRIRQHNGQIKPRCSLTRHRDDWRFVHIIHGFPNGGKGQRLARVFEARLQQALFCGNDRLRREQLARTVAAEWRRAPNLPNVIVDVVPE